MANVGTRNASEVEHRCHGLFVEKRPVLDGGGPGSHGVLHCGRRVGVHRHRNVCGARRCDDVSQLTFAEKDVGGAAEDASASDHLHDVRTGFELRVCDCGQLRCRLHPDPDLLAGGSRADDDLARALHRRPVDVAGGERFAQREIDVAVTADVAHSRHAGADGIPGFRSRGVGHVGRTAAIDRRDEREVCVSVDQTWDDRQTIDVDPACPCWDGSIRELSASDDAAA
jgi:hypothetical protein